MRKAILIILLLVDVALFVASVMDDDKSAKEKLNPPAIRAPYIDDLHIGPRIEQRPRFDYSMEDPGKMLKRG